jgi:beta-phosphoglucomutase-like phosphatase (HAD superfamily)
MADNKYLAPIRAIIFDMDGTIVDTEHVWGSATKKPLMARGRHTFTSEEEAMLDSFSGCSIEEWAFQVKEAFGFEDDHLVIASEAVANAAEGFASRVPFIEGFEKFHALISDYELKSGIATNTKQHAFDNIIEKMEFRTFFGQHLYCVDHVGGLAKPDPAIFLHVAEQLNVHPSECLVFEDSVFGFDAAKAAGMRCVGIRNRRNRAHIGRVDYVVDNYHDAIVLLHELLKEVQVIQPTSLDIQQAQ